MTLNVKEDFGERPHPESSITKRVREFQKALPQFGVPTPRTMTREQAEQRRCDEQLRTHEVYFLYCCGRIKIGTSRHPMRRVMMDIMPYCPAPMSIVGTIPGGPIVEGGLHTRFDGARIRDEWFWLTDDLRKFLCEDEKRMCRLQDAEDSYEEWLEEELSEQQQINASTGDRSEGDFARPIPGPEDGD